MTFSWSDWRIFVVYLTMGLWECLRCDRKLADQVADYVAQHYVVDYVTVVSNSVYYVSELV